MSKQFCMLHRTQIAARTGEVAGAVVQHCMMLQVAPDVFDRVQFRHGQMLQGEGSTPDLKIQRPGVQNLIDSALSDTDDLLRLAPRTRLPLSSVQPGKRLKTASHDLYGFSIYPSAMDKAK
jgi:hypothetical protein